VNIKAYMADIGRKARAASRLLATATTGAKNDALLAIATLLEEQSASLIKANEKDMQAGREKGLDAALLDRLELNQERITGMAEGLRQIAALPDPVGEITNLNYRPSGIQVGKMRVPLGVIGIIYESRPNVTADAAALCMKSGNAAILRGGSEALNSNQAIAHCIHQGLEKVGLPVDVVQVLDTPDRAAVGELISMPEFVDVIVPRGGKGLIEHVYIDDRADIDKAIAVAFNAKTHRYGVCNAMETLLVHEAVAADVLPKLAEQYQQEGVELRGCAATQKILSGIVAATEEDWDTEYLAPILSIRVVADIAEAIEHIHQHGSGHTESIMSEDIGRARTFMTEVDASSVMINTSTRFADGFEYGLGAEIGISTDKIHVRGPVGLEGLTSQKYIVIGDGHVRT